MDVAERWDKYKYIFATFAQIYMERNPFAYLRVPPSRSNNPL